MHVFQLNPDVTKCSHALVAQAVEEAKHFLELMPPKDRQLWVAAMNYFLDSPFIKVGCTHQPLYM
jgi:hypothetical protein